MPSAIGNLRGLEELEFGFNSIKEVPKEIGMLTKITRINAARNGIASLPTEMSKLSSLSIIDLSYNQFAVFPQVLTTTKNLKAIDISYCKVLSQIPDNVKNLQSVRLFNIVKTRVPSARVDDLKRLLPECTIMI